jgi:transposase IS166 family protein
VRREARIQPAPVSTPSPSLPEDPMLLQHLLLEAQAEITRLQLLIACLLRHQFGRRSERLGDDMLQPRIENLEQSLAGQAATIEAAQPASEARCPTICRGSRSSSMSRTRLAPAAARRCMRSPKTAPR